MMLPSRTYPRPSGESRLWAAPGAYRGIDRLDDGCCCSLAWCTGETGLTHPTLYTRFANPRSFPLRRPLSHLPPWWNTRPSGYTSSARKTPARARRSSRVAATPGRARLLALSRYACTAAETVAFNPAPFFFIRWHGGTLLIVRYTRK